MAVVRMLVKAMMMVTIGMMVGSKVQLAIRTGVELLTTTSRMNHSEDGLQG